MYGTGVEISGCEASVLILYSRAWKAHWKVYKVLLKSCTWLQGYCYIWKFRCMDVWKISHSSSAHLSLLVVNWTWYSTNNHIRTRCLLWNIGFIAWLAPSGILGHLFEEMNSMQGVQYFSSLLENVFIHSSTCLSSEIFVIALYTNLSTITS